MTTVDRPAETGVADLVERVRAFIRESVIPREGELGEHGNIVPELIAELRAKAKAAGIFAPHVGREFGGLGLDHRAQAAVFEAAGYSLLGPIALNISAPDEGNMHLLEVVASDEQKERYLRPLAAGEIRSVIAMTEPPPGAGSDPSMLRTSARRDGSGHVIDGTKWFITGAMGAAFAICIAKTAGGATMFLVDADNPGFTVREAVGSLDGAFLGGHCVVEFNECRVPASAVLGEVGRGFEYAQVRLGPARLTHCMRWLGIAVRSLEVAIRYVRERDGFGRRLSEHQMVQAMIADSVIDIDLSRLAIADAARVLDEGGHARKETGLAKVFVSEAVNRVVDRALQMCGSSGISDRLPLERFYREVRAFRIYDGPSEVHRVSLAKRAIRSVR